MAGRFRVSDEDRQAISGAQLWDGAGWVPFAQPANRFSTIRSKKKTQESAR